MLPKKLLRCLQKIDSIPHFRYPHRKMHILRTLVLLELTGYYMVRFAPPWETGEPLMLLRCTAALDQLTLTTDDHVNDPCLVSKIKEHYAGSHQCEYR